MEQKKEKVLIAGGTGMIGQRLQHTLLKNGYQVNILSRVENLELDQYGWNPAIGQINPEAFAGVTKVINLSGAGIADKRWTPQRKEVLHQSRIQSTKLLWSTIRDLKQKPNVFINGSAIGYYRDQGSRWISEDSHPDDDFLGTLCTEWENVFTGHAVPSVRSPIIRVGMVLDPTGGILAQLMKTYKFGFGTYFGNGQMYYSWIHYQDLVDLMVHIMETDSLREIYNGVAPNPTPMKDLVQVIGKIKKTHLVLPVPKLAMKIAMGQRTEMIWKGSRVSAEKVKKSNYTFQYPSINKALEHLLAE